MNHVFPTEAEWQAFSWGGKVGCNPWGSVNDGLDIDHKIMTTCLSYTAGKTINGQYEKSVWWVNQSLGDKEEKYPISLKFVPV